MSKFTDCMGVEWDVSFDGLTLEALRTEKKIDLADVVSSVYTQLKRDPATLVTVLTFLCDDQIKSQRLSAKDFSKRIIGKVIDEAFNAVWRAAENFFPPSLWSNLSTRLKEEEKVMKQWLNMKPMVEMFNQKEMPPEVKEFVFKAIAEMLPSFASSELGVVRPEPEEAEEFSATGLGAILQTPASDLRDSAELVRGG